MASDRRINRSASLGIMKVLTTLLFVIGLMILSGVAITYSLMPSSSENLEAYIDTTTHRYDMFSNNFKLSDKIHSWYPLVNPNTLNINYGDEKNVLDYTKEFYTPIRLSIGDRDVDVTLCKLNFKQYASAPYSLPMFKDLVRASICSGSNIKQEKLSDLIIDIRKNSNGVGDGFNTIPPTGFVFHEGRVGSTLVANLLGSNPNAMMFTEAEPPLTVLTACAGCDRQRKIELFRDVVTLMGRSPIHKYMFFKFQSVATTEMEIALEAFPDTAWSFIYRNPVQTMMSHVDPHKGANGPCLRSKHSMPIEITKVLDALNDPAAANSDVAWCAGHLNMLCNAALNTYTAHGLYPSTGNQRGMLVNYDSLPGAVPKALLPLFGISQISPEWIAHMLRVSTKYSKARSTGSSFTGDSRQKNARATVEMRRYAAAIMQPTYASLLNYTKEALATVLSPEELELITRKHAVDTGGEDVMWSELSIIETPLGNEPLRAGNGNLRKRSAPDTVSIVRTGHRIDNLHGSESANSTIHALHSRKVGITREYYPWSPFSNTHDSQPFQNVFCPDTPPDGYPSTYSMLDIIKNWNPDVTDIPEKHYDSICHFDYKTEYNKAEAYRQAEVPFVVYNHPEVDKVARKWNNIDYLDKKLGSKQYRAETSSTNHFMYFANVNSKTAKQADGVTPWTPPTSVIHSTFEDWLQVAVKGQNASLDKKHEYFRASSDMGNPWLFDELSFFKPKKSLFIVEPGEQKGIHCRFGMKSIIAEAHFDGSRNAVAQLGGLRRWIMTHPNQCKEMHMFPRGHPSGRHSKVDWSKPDIAAFPNFKNVVGNEVILQPGDVLYVPTYWIHYIVSLNVNFQCNTRSGRTKHFDQDIRNCGF